MTGTIIENCIASTISVIFLPLKGSLAKHSPNDKKISLPIFLNNTFFKLFHNIKMYNSYLFKYTKENGKSVTPPIQIIKVESTNRHLSPLCHLYIMSRILT